MLPAQFIAESVVHNKKNTVIKSISKSYSKLPALRALVSLIPYVGGAFDILLNESWTKISERRVESLFKNLENELKNVDQNTIRKDFIESEEFHDILGGCINSSTKTRHQEKIAIYSRIIKKSLIENDFDTDEYEEIKQIIDSLTIRELRISLALYEWESRLKNEYLLILEETYDSRGIWDSFIKYATNKTGIEKENIHFILIGLEQKALFSFKSYDISERGEQFKIDNPRISYSSFMHGQSTELFVRIKNYLSNEK